MKVLWVCSENSTACIIKTGSWGQKWSVSIGGFPSFWFSHASSSCIYMPPLCSSFWISILQVYFFIYFAEEEEPDRLAQQEMLTIIFKALFWYLWQRRNRTYLILFLTLHTNRHEFVRDCTIDTNCSDLCPSTIEITSHINVMTRFHYNWSADRMAPMSGSS